MTDARFALKPHLDFLYQARPELLALRATTREEFEGWQSALRSRLAQLLGLEGREPIPPSVEKLYAVDRDFYIEEKYCLDVGEQAHAPMYVLVPRRAPPFKPVLVFHGHEPGVQFILGHGAGDDTAPETQPGDGNYAQTLAQAGYLVCAVEQRGLGERLTNQTGDGPFPRSCRHLAFVYLMHGRTLLGERCWDALCAILYLQSRPDVQVGVLGCLGHSGGSCTALWLSALDPRITVVVVSGYFCSFKASILAMPHCECNYVPGVLEWAEMGDVSALIAPRPFCAVNGARDPIFPVEGAAAQFETVKRAYALYGRAEACSLTFHPGAHEYRHEAGRAWLARWMA